MALHGLPVAIHSGGGGPDRSQPVQNEIGEKLFWTRLALEARIQKQIHATGSASAEEALLHLLETQEEQDRWLIENRDAINAKIRRGIAQLDRGEGIPEDALDAYLTEQKAKPE